MWQFLMIEHKRLTLKEREKIHALVNKGKTNREISLALNRSHTTISRELKRCETKFEYPPSKADKKARKEESPDNPKDAFPGGELRKLFTSFLRSERKLRKYRSNVHSRIGGIQDAPPYFRETKRSKS